MQSNITSTDLSEAPQLLYFTTDNNNNNKDTHSVFGISNPQMIQTHQQYSICNYPLPRMINNSQIPHSDHHRALILRDPPQQPQPAEALAHRYDTKMIGHSLPVNYCFKLGPGKEGNNDKNRTSYNERVFGHHHLHGQKFMMPKFCRQTHRGDEEYYPYSTVATKEPFHWNNYAVMDDIPNANEKNNKVDVVMMREDIRVCNTNNNNNEEVVVDEREQFMRFYGELEAIYGLAKNNNVILGETSYNQTGSSSALTAENSPVGANLPDDPTPFCDDNNEASQVRNEIHKKKRKRKRKRKELLFKSMTGFFEGLVENVMSHQDRLHGKFMEAIEKLDRERSEREEAWRRREAQAQSREAAARANEQAMASTRQALIVSYLEKITGQRVVDLPRNGNNYLPFLSREFSNLEELSRTDKFESANIRWPGREVEALMRIRSDLEAKFEDQPGLMKSPIWEEVSELMASMDYKRSAKSCKEKWDFINKYLSCYYFDNDLGDHQICSIRSPQEKDPSSSFTPNLCSTNVSLVDGFGVRRQSYVELLKAFTTDEPSSSISVGKLFEVSEMGSRKLDFGNGEFEDDLVEEDQEDNNNLDTNNED